MWFNKSESLQLKWAVVLTFVMVFSTWTITDRSFRNFLDGDNLTSDEVILFCFEGKRWEYPKMYPLEL